VDAKERLRLYLEQRRDLGESELVLDTLPVADVLALIGAGGAGTARPLAPRRPKAAPAPEAAPVAPDEVPEAPRAAASVSPDAPDTAVPPEVTPPPTPAPRFDPSSADRDWRAALRAQGVGEGSAIVRPDTPTPAPEPRASSSAAPAPTADPTPAPAPPVEAVGDVAAVLDASPLPGWLTALGLPSGIAVGRALHAPAGVSSLDEVATAIAACSACALGATATNHVPGEGNPQADFVLVGEAPGQNEDETGRPFVGAAGQLLTKILAAIKFAREDVFICNVLKHRPPGNSTPTPDEVRACRPFLEQQLALLQPRVILALGTSAAHALLGTTQSLGSLRGKVHRYHGVPVVVTYHPAALLRNEAWKRPTWEDVQLARRIHDASREASGA
jgi:DNA polymerase